MNFILRNIWWVLLFCFFIVMLLIISMNNPNNNDTITEDTSNNDVQLDDYAQEDDIINWLIKRLEDEIIWDIDDVNIEDDNQVSTHIDDRWWNYIDAQDDTSDISTTVRWDNWTSMHQKISNTYISTDVYKKNDNDIIASYRDKIYYEVFTYSLRLNNIFFDTTLGYLMKWDVVKRKWDIYTSWCFEVEVMISSTAQGKTWYVCKRFVTPVSEDVIYSDISWSYTQNNISSFPYTEIGDVITLTNFQLDIGNKAIFDWDQIDQMTEIDSDGCFIWRIFYIQPGGYTELKWHVQVFCNYEIYR